MTPYPNNINPRVWTLTNAVCEGTISEQEVQELEALLEADPKALEFYIDFLKINVEILWLVSVKPHSTMDSGNQTPQALSDRSPILGFLGDWANFFNQHSPLSFVLLFVCFGAIFATLFWLSNPRSGKISAEPQYVAEITNMQDCQWSAAMPPSEGTMQLHVGRKLQLEKGLLQITYSNKAVVLLEGPVSYTVDSPKSGFLSRGKLAAKAESKESRNFTIATPSARFVDLGTEFGVMIDRLGRSSVAVFEGKVTAAAKKADGLWTAPVPLIKGEAAVCEGAGFTHQIALRSDYPSLAPVPPPPPPTLAKEVSGFQRWSEFSRELQKRKDIIAYYDFQQDPNNKRVLFNRAVTGSAYDGKAITPKWVDGRFQGKNALEFKLNSRGMCINLPREMKLATLAAWVKIESLKNNPEDNHNSLLMSDAWRKPFATHWFLRTDGSLRLAMQNGEGSIPDVGIGDGTSIQETGKTPEVEAVVENFGQWCLLATVYDPQAKTITSYYNGYVMEKHILTEFPLIQFGSAMIGGWYPSADRKEQKCLLDGRMDELMIFEAVLSQEEIQAMYEAGKP